MVFTCAPGIGNMTVSHRGALKINILRIWCNDLGTDGANDLQHLVIIVHGILEVMRGIVIFLLIPVIHLLQPDDLLHRRVSKVEPEILVVSIEICHWCFFLRSDCC